MWLMLGIPDSYAFMKMENANKLQKITNPIMSFKRKGSSDMVVKYIGIHSRLLILVIISLGLGGFYLANLQFQDLSVTISSRKPRRG